MISEKMNDELKSTVLKDCDFKKIKQIYNLNLFLVYYETSNSKLYLNIVAKEQANAIPFTIECSCLQKRINSTLLDVMTDLALSDRMFDSNYKFSNENCFYRMHCPSVFNQIREPYVEFFSRLANQDDESFCFCLKQDDFNLLYGYLETKLISDCASINRRR